MPVTSPRGRQPSIRVWPMTRVGVLGAGGRMGREVCRAVAADPDLDLVAAVDPGHAGEVLADLTDVEVDLVMARSVDALSEVSAEVAVDFTVAASAVEHLAWCAGHGVHAVVGTSGITADQLARAAAAFADGRANAVVAANFAVTAVLLMRFAELAAPFVDGVDIVELHHDTKRDAPSGTALRTAERLAEARRRSGRDPWPGDKTVDVLLTGARGAEGPGGVRIHSVRLPGLVAHQEIIMGAVGQGLTLRHDAYDRTSFMPGVLLAIKAVGRLPGMTLGLDDVLGL